MKALEDLKCQIKSNHEPRIYTLLPSFRKFLKGSNHRYIMRVECPSILISSSQVLGSFSGSTPFFTSFKPVGRNLKNKKNIKYLGEI